jgi:hypothetical protein
MLRREVPRAQNERWDLLCLGPAEVAKLATPQPRREEQGRGKSHQ